MRYRCSDNTLNNSNHPINDLSIDNFSINTYTFLIYVYLILTLLS